MLADIVDVLRCPVCGRPLDRRAGALACAVGHSFDVAREGYVNLLVGSAVPGTADTAAMVAARADLLGAGHYRPLAESVAATARDLVPGDARGVVCDVGAGTGHYLSTVLDALPGRSGLALDISKYAARAAARADPRIGAAVCDTWKALPVRDGTCALVLDIFAPRNPPEMRRVLSDRGAIVVVTPTGRHLEEVRDSLGLVAIDDRKDARLRDGFRGVLPETSSRTLEWTMTLTRADVRALVEMGPSARHVSAEDLSSRIGDLVEPAVVTGSTNITVYGPPPR